MEKYHIYTQPQTMTCIECPGPTSLQCDQLTPLQCFRLLFTSTIWDYLVNKTNGCARHKS